MMKLELAYHIKMKFLFLVFVLFSGRHTVSTQLQLPGINTQAFQVPKPFENVASNMENQVQGFVKKLGQNQPVQQIETPRVFEQWFTPSVTIIPANPFNSLTQELPNIFNASFLQNLFIPSDYRQNSNLNDISDPQVKQTSDQNSVDAWSNAANESLTQGLERIKLLRDRLNETTISIIAASENAATTGIAEIETHLAQYNETVQNCARSNASQYQEIIPAARDEAIECIRRKRNEGFSIIAEGRQNINDAVNGAQNLSATIQQCSLPDVRDRYVLGVIGCYASAIINIRSETILLPILITRRFGEIDDEVVTIQSDVIKCGAGVTETISAQGLNVTQTIANCVIEK